MRNFEAQDSEWLRKITTIATDIDGTLTDEHGHFSEELIRAFLLCKQTGIKVILITGRPASWVQGMVEYFPVAGGIGENGGLYCPKQKEAPMRVLVGSNNDLPEVTLEYVERGRLARMAMFADLKLRFPQLRPTGDCVTRLTDFTFPLDNLSIEDLVLIESMCRAKSFGFTYSSIHGHIKDPDQHKASGILKLIQNVPELAASVEQIVTVGDSRNDQEMFDPQHFPYSVGVANIAKHLPHMHIHPAYVTAEPGVIGFCQLVDLLIESRKQ